MKYKKDNCNKTQIDKCQREDFLMEGAKQNGDLVVGKPLFTELSSGKQSDNPKDFEIKPQIVEKIPGDSGDGGICSISTVGNKANHPFGLATIGFAAGLGMLVTRRRKGFIGIERK